MWYLCRKGDSAVDIPTQTYGNHFVRVRCKVFALYLPAVTQIVVFHDAAVKAEAAVVVADGPQSEILYMQCAEWLEELAVRTLHMQL